LTVASVKVIPATGVGYPDYGQAISGQSAGVISNPEWQASLGNQKQLALQATNLNTWSLDNAYARYVATASYTVTSGKNFYIWLLSALMTYATVTSTFNWIVEIFDNTTGTRVYAFGSVGSQASVQFTQPLVIPSGHQVLLNFYNYGTPGIGGVLVGNNAIGGTNVPPVGVGLLTAYSKFVATQTSGLLNIVVYLYAYASTGTVIAALYSDNGGVPGNVLVQSAATAFAPGSSWVVVPVNLTQVVARTTYWLAASMSSTYYSYFYCDASPSNYLYYNKGAYGAFGNNPAGLTGLGAYQMSIYGIGYIGGTYDYNTIDARIAGYEL
jgi:hypothetical protein